MAVHFLEAQVQGVVQGVGFRHFTVQEARRLGLTGWVKNQRDGSVRVQAEGEERNLQEFLQSLHEGPPASKVDQVDVEWGEATGRFKHFKARIV